MTSIHVSLVKSCVNANMKFQVIIRAVDRLPIIFSSNFSFENRRFNAGQYSYSINSNFEPIQLPQVNLGKEF